MKDRDPLRAWPLVAVALACAGLAATSCESGRERPEPASASSPALSPSARAVSPASVAAPELQSLSDRGWARLPQRERVELITQRFDRALTRIERDRRDTHAVHEAQRALSLLRTELGDDEAAVRRYDALEQRLTALTE